MKNKKAANSIFSAVILLFMVLLVGVAAGTVTFANAASEIMSDDCDPQREYAQVNVQLHWLDENGQPTTEGLPSSVRGTIGSQSHGTKTYTFYLNASNGWNYVDPDAKASSLTLEEVKGWKATETVSWNSNANEYICSFIYKPAYTVEYRWADSSESASYRLEVGYSNIYQAKLPETGEFCAGETVTVDNSAYDIIKTPDGVYRFTGWTVEEGVSETNGEFKMPSHNVVCTGTWEKVDGWYVVKYDWARDYTKWQYGSPGMLFYNDSGEFKGCVAGWYQAGETVTVDTKYKKNYIDSSNGYRAFSGWTPYDAGNKAIEITDGSFTMPASDVLITGEFTEIENYVPITSREENGTSHGITQLQISSSINHPHFRCQSL